MGDMVTSGSHIGRSTDSIRSTEIKAQIAELVESSGLSTVLFTLVDYCYDQEETNCQRSQAIGWPKKSAEYIRDAKNWQLSGECLDATARKQYINMVS